MAKEIINWANEIGQEVNDSKDELNKIKLKASEEINYDFQLIENADNQLAKLEYQSNRINNIKDNAKPSEGIKILLDVAAGTAALIHTRLVEINQKWNKTIEEKQFFVKAVENTSFTSDTSIYYLDDIAIKTCALQIEEIKKEREKIENVSHKEIYIKLKNILQKLGDKYINMLDGSEQSLKVDNPDHFSQCAHSTRDLVDQLLNQLAPNKDIKVQQWFTPTPDSKSGITRKDRIRFILSKNRSINEKSIEVIEKQAKLGINKLDEIIKLAHNHDKEKQNIEIEETIDQMRRWLLQLLLVSG